ncbi:MAG TPA: M50 family metallopeptidase [Bacillaceae bacterium]|nr:M50 family metallopeptidase [Bacillaceae bacterium]
MNKYIDLIKKINIHPLFWAVTGLAIMTGYFWELLALFCIVFLHELGHAFMAHYYDWKIKRILILPFGGYCEVDEHGNRSMQEELMVILAGPFQHLIIAILLPILVMASVVTADYAKVILQFNVMILIFNLLPIWPLDGGKLIQLFFATRNTYLEANRLSLVVSAVVLGMLHLFIFIYSPWNINVWLVLIYLSVSLWTAWKQLRFSFMRFLMERHYGKHEYVSQLQTINAKGDEYLHEVFTKFKRGCKHLIYVAGPTHQGKLDENELLYAYFTEKRVDARLKDLVYDD